MEELAASVETTSEVQKLGTISGAGVSALISRTCAERKTRRISGWVLIGGSFGWILGLLLANLSHETLPWCATFLLISGGTIAWLYGKSNGSALHLFKLGELRPIATSEGLAISFFAFSCVLCIFMSIYKFAPNVPVVRRQIVDIEFVSGADAVDRHDILPGTKEKASQKKMSSNALVSSHGRAMSQQRMPAQMHQGNEKVARNGSSPAASQQPAVDNNRMFVAQQPDVNRAKATAPSNAAVIARRTPANTSAPISTRRQDEAKAPPMVVVSHPASFVSATPLASMAAGGSHWQTQTVAPSKSARVSAPRTAATLEEVAPPELVEMTDSQGETHANEVWQAGGHSKGGTGSPSTLATYLKDLHRRIKRAWVPPVGETRTAQILFRIKRTGNLTSIKLERSSGNPDSDEAAMAAIASCSPFKSLPDDYPSDYIDLEYTFNYTVDRLSESPGHQM